MYKEDRFLGESVSYWLELKNRAEKLGIKPLLYDIIKLSAKVNYYESKLDEIQKFRENV